MHRQETEPDQPAPIPEPTPSSTPLPTHTSSPTATATPSSTPTATPSLTPSPTASPTATASPTPLPTPDGITRTARVPILMYHHIASPPPDADAVRRDLSLPPEAFERQLQYLVEQGYTSITLSDLIHHLARGAPLPPEPIILTFDDGYRDVYTEAFPLLRRYGMTSTFFLITSFIDQGERDYLSWAQVKEMHRAGMEFGSHTYTHPDLRGKPIEYLVWQILGSKEAIEQRIQEPVRFFSYPSGRYNRQTVEILRSAHFWGAVSTQQGVEQSSEHPFELQRIRVRGDDTLASFAARLEAEW
ncbi:MAG: polysaccharide deacetylase family protein [Chloroflexota bacterium]|nr:polysaccharide deacetylase family protein [Chloroflexota bacterium]